MANYTHFCFDWAETMVQGKNGGQGFWKNCEKMANLWGLFMKMFEIP